MPTLERHSVSEPVAAGMLSALTRGHRCGVPCTATVTLGDGRQQQLTCPYARLDVRAAGDRRIVATLYANEARAAMGG